MRLLLMRHATTEPPEVAKNDLQRNLMEIGIAEAKKAAEFLRSYNIDKMIVSYAERTKQTANIIAAANQYPDEKIVITKNLYKSNVDKIISKVIARQDDEPAHEQNILILGHNPAIYDLVLQLADDRLPGYDSLFVSCMVPSQIIVLNFKEIEFWHQVNCGQAVVEDIFIP